MTDPDWERLHAAWQPAREAGVLGDVSIEALRQHAVGFVPAACGVLEACVDLGTGAGVPGIILALLHPTSRWTLVDASERRCSLARRVVHAMELSDRVAVRHARAEDVAHDVSARGHHDLVVARLLGPLADTLELATPLVRPGSGRAVVSADAATAARVADSVVHGLVVETRQIASGHYVDVTVPGELPPTWPRRPATRRRTPLF